jgi:uncharacterized membrane protein YfcA
VIDLLIYLSAGLAGGLLGGYLGLGGGVIMVPYLTVIAGLDIKAAVPVSVSAIMVNSFSSSTAYLKKGMVDMETAVVLSVSMILGNMIGSSMSEFVSSHTVRLVFTLILLYAAFSFMRTRAADNQSSITRVRKRPIALVMTIALFAGCLAGLTGVGGGIVLVPMMYLLMGMPLATSRGTSTFLIGFSAAAACAVYYFAGHLNLIVTAPVVLGVILGGRIGGHLGTIAKPMAVKVLFVIVLLYMAYRLGFQSLMELL